MNLSEKKASSRSDENMPAIFAGHGNPMFAISDNRYSRTWRAIGEKLPRPRAILAISAHWTTEGKVAVTDMDHPRTIHDFGGFPEALYTQEYPAPGDPVLAKEICTRVQSPLIECDDAWGLDHGTWTILMHLFPKADIPVVQLSLDLNQPPQFHFDLGRALCPLRKKGILIFGSGNITHNLSKLHPGGEPAGWALAFDEKVKQGIDTRDDESLIQAKESDKLYQIAHPTDEHYLPLLYILAQRGADDTVTYFNDDIDLGTLSMRSFLLS